jgi:hypothetical protein
MTLEDLTYQWLTHGMDKNGISHADAMDRARATLVCMPNDEFLELISSMLEQRLEGFVLNLECNK